MNTNSTTKALNYLLTTLKRHHAELLSEKQLIKKEKARKAKLESSIKERSVKWEKLLNEQDVLKRIYLQARQALQEEEKKLDNVKLDLTKYRGQLHSKQKLAKRRKKVAQQAKANFESFYDKQIHLEKLSHSLLLELRQSNLSRKQEKAAAIRRKQNIIKNEETLHQVNQDMSQVHQVLMNSLHVPTRRKTKS
jgi:hypothetical protein